MPLHARGPATGALVALLVGSAATVGGGHRRPAAAPSVSARRAAPGYVLSRAVRRGQATGDIEGQVIVPASAPRRVAEHYALGQTVVHTVESVPPVVMLKGAMPDAAPPPGEAPRLAQHDTAFEPAAVVVQVGHSVSFPNQDPFFHNVFSYSPTKRFDLGRYPKGESKSVTFDKPGIVKVYCEVHKHMRAVIVVTENPFAAVVDADGRFVLRGVPAGRHELEVWTADRGTRTAVVDVPPGGSTHVQVSFAK